MTDQPLSEPICLVCGDSAKIQVQEKYKQSIQKFLKELKEGLFGSEKPMGDNQAIDFIDTLAKQKFGDKLL